MSKVRDVEGGGLTLAWTRVTYSVPGKTIVDMASGRCRSGRLCAVMGPSGSGKTTLLDLLALRVDRTRSGRSVTGTVTLNGAPFEAANRVMAYVQQEDALVGVLTVRETLTFARVLANAAPGRVDDLIRQLGLESAAETRCGTIFSKGISGGQKRRVSIAIELMASPKLLLLDEPTSGLDSASALAVVSHLSALAVGDGCAVMATMHQPSDAVWAKLDDVCFLARGKLVYFGPSQEPLLTFLEEVKHPVGPHQNVADFVLSLINEDFPNHADVEGLVKAFAATPEGTQLDDGNAPVEEQVAESWRPQNRRAAFPTRFAALCVRNLAELARDVGIIGVRLAMYSMLAFLISLMYWGLGSQKGDSDVVSRVSILFYIAAFLVFMSVAVLPFFVMGRGVFIKERCNGAYGVPEFVLAKFIVAAPGIFLICIVSTALVVPITGLKGFSVFLLDLFLSLMVAESFMALIAACVPHYIIGIALAAGVFGFFMLCEGFFRVRSDIPKGLMWAYHLAFHTYTFRIFMHNEFNTLGSLDGPRFTDGKAVLRFYDMSHVNVFQDCLVLLLNIVFFQIAFALVLQLYHTGKR